jgi:hypothetical protein
MLNLVILSNTTTNARVAAKLQARGVWTPPCQDGRRQMHILPEKLRSWIPDLALRANPRIGG